MNKLEHVSDDMRHLKKEFDLNKRYNGILLESDLEPIPHIPSNLKNDIKERAVRSNMTVEEYLINLIKKDSLS